MQFGKHGLTAMLGQECWESNYDYLSVSNTGLPNDAVHNPALGTAEPKAGEGWGSSSMASFFTRETYKDRKSTRLNSSHANISYAVFCLKKNKSRSGGSA